jgi:adhesin transport system outer membrane protein
MHFVLKHFIPSFMVLAGTMAWASSEPTVLSLEQAMALATASHPLVEQKRRNLDASAQDMKSAQWKWFPTLTLETSQTVGGQPQILGNSDPYAGNIKVEQPLWTGGRITSEVDMAQARKQITQLQLHETQQDLMLRVLQAFFDYQKLSARLSIAEDNIHEHQRLYELISRRQKQQVTSEADVALAFARLQQVMAERNSMRAQHQASRLSLEQLTGRAFTENMSLPEAAERTLVWQDAWSAQQAAQATSPILHRLRAEILLSEADLNFRKNQVLPQINLRHERFMGATISVPFDRTMFVLQYQPGSGVSAWPSMDAAVKRIEASQSAYESGVREVTEKVSSQWVEVKSFKEMLDVTNQYVAASQEVMASYLRQYTAGRKTWLEVLNAQREWVQARYAQVDNAFAFKLGVYKLDVLTGVIKHHNESP